MGAGEISKIIASRCATDTWKDEKYLYRAKRE